MRPEFSMTSDSTEPLVTSCTAHWRVSGGETSVKFETGQTAFTVSRLVDEAYAAGLIDGRKEIVAALVCTVKELSA